MGRENIPEICQMACPLNDHKLEPNFANALSSDCAGPVISYQETADKRITIEDDQIIDLDESTTNTRGVLACANAGLNAYVEKMEENYGDS